MALRPVQGPECPSHESTASEPCPQPPSEFSWESQPHAHRLPPFIPSSPVGSCRSPGSPEEHLHFGKDRFWGRRSHQCPVNRAHYSCGIGGEVRGSGGRNFRGPSLLPKVAPCTEGVSETGNCQGHPSISRWGEQGCMTGLLLQHAGPYASSPLLRCSPLDSCS